MMCTTNQSKKGQKAKSSEAEKNRASIVKKQLLIAARSLSLMMPTQQRALAFHRNVQSLTTDVVVF
jgi:hypothetical protein